jgi:hypothetical protein
MKSNMEKKSMSIQLIIMITVIPNCPKNLNKSIQTPNLPKYEIPNF